jgi:hypothetical protein
MEHVMNAENILVQELFRLCVSYLAGTVRLHSLASRSETLVGQMQAVLPPQDFACAMNCVYLFEEINALVLDENRLPTQEEDDSIRDQLNRLENILADISKKEKIE